MSSLLLGSALMVGACDRQAATPEQANSAAAATDEATAAPAAPKAVSGVFDRSHKGEAAPATAFVAPDGKPASLADFRGGPVLVNLWATWCAPCVAELPTLDKAARALDGRVRVIAVSQDLEETPDKVRAFLKDRGFAALQPYRDPKLGLSTGYGVNLPATILYDAQGREVWRRLGAFEWNSAEAARAIAEAG
jgi:thiol-disulfide isomerase/thioredoxin